MAASEHITRYLNQDYSDWPIEKGCSPTSARLKFEVLDPTRKVKMRFESAGQVCEFMRAKDPAFKVSHVYAATGLNVGRNLAERLEKHGWVRRVPAGSL